MIKELLRVANALDEKGFRKEADALDAIIKEAFSPAVAVKPILPIVNDPWIQQHTMDPGTPSDKPLDNEYCVTLADDTKERAVLMAEPSDMDTEEKVEKLLKAKFPTLKSFSKGKCS